MKVAGVIAAALALVGVLGWFAAEQHYDNCVDAARARSPITLTQGKRESIRRDWSQEDPLKLGSAEAQAEQRLRQARVAAVEGCSRLPF